MFTTDARLHRVCLMDVNKPSKQSALEIPKLPLGPSERNTNASQRIQTREAASRYRTPTPTAHKRSSLPMLPTTSQDCTLSASRRAQSTERKRPSCSSGTKPLLRHSSIDTHFQSRKLSCSHEGLWPSMRSLSISFHSDTISVPITQKEKPPIDTPFRTPSRKPHESTLRGKNTSDQFGMLTDQKRLPSRVVGKLSSSKSLDLTDNNENLFVYSKELVDSLLTSFSDKISSSSYKVTSSRSRNSSPVKSSGSRGVSPVKGSGSRGVSPVKGSGSRGVSPVKGSGSRGVSPVKGSGSRGVSPVKGSGSRGVSPVKGSGSRPSTPPSRGESPSKGKATQQSNPSVLSFMADVKKGKKGANQLEEVHHLRLVHNRYLQWRLVNARAETVLKAQKFTSEKALHDIREGIFRLMESMTQTRVALYQIHLELKVNIILNGQMGFLEGWALLEHDHTDAVIKAVDDLQAATIRVPLIEGAKVGKEILRAAICSAIDVMQMIVSSIAANYSIAENLDALASELANVTTTGRLMLSLLLSNSPLASFTALQIECSLRTQLIQLMNESTRRRP